jgi:hypothetical protein
MDIEFHYYMTYLIAVRAGIAPDTAVTIAKSAQEVDDNHIPIIVSQGSADAYENTLSQTMDILRPHHARRIYPVFHFIPGDPDSPLASRKDGARSPWTTTPDSELANIMLDTALKSADPYRIGASAHAYADTWAHQNFLGKDDVLNEMPSNSMATTIKNRIAMLRIGHALAGHQPDIPDLIWQDDRLVNPTIVNAERFLDAAVRLFGKFRSLANGSTVADDQSELASLVQDLRSDIGKPSPVSSPREGRVERYRRRALMPEYGSRAIPEYRVGEWSDTAFVEQRADLLTRMEVYVAEHAGQAGDILAFGTKMPCTWKDPPRYRETEWYRFQEAIKAHLDECWGILQQRFPNIASR